MWKMEPFTGSYGPKILCCWAGVVVQAIYLVAVILIVKTDSCWIFGKQDTFSWFYHNLKKVTCGVQCEHYCPLTIYHMSSIILTWLEWVISGFCFNSEAYSTCPPSLPNTFHTVPVQSPSSTCSQAGNNELAWLDLILMEKVLMLFWQTYGYLNCRSTAFNLLSAHKNNPWLRCVTFHCLTTQRLVFQGDRQLVDGCPPLPSDVFPLGTLPHVTWVAKVTA